MMATNVTIIMSAKNRYTAASDIGPASFNRFATGSIWRFNPSSDRDPSNTRSPGSPKITSSMVEVPTAYSHRPYQPALAGSQRVLDLDVDSYVSLRDYLVSVELTASLP